MSRPCPTTDVVNTVRRVIEVTRGAKSGGYKHVPYDLVVSILRHEVGYTEPGANALIFEAVMSGVAVLELQRIPTTDRKETLCVKAD